MYAVCISTSPGGQLLCRHACIFLFFFILFFFLSHESSETSQFIDASQDVQAFTWHSYFQPGYKVLVFSPCTQCLLVHLCKRDEAGTCMWLLLFLVCSARYVKKCVFTYRVHDLGIVICSLFFCLSFLLHLICLFLHLFFLLFNKRLFLFFTILGAKQMDGQMNKEKNERLNGLINIYVMDGWMDR